ncbi:alpha-1-antichymotrypsin [Echinops telfairi]|uniref:Alpha-1-antichymotrypsin n=1 Tax=Echinops telfairi TaxID=9371 RepID=A0ABM0IFG8_ECHTE|nr:alpha-1-antichymotrypsin [Echinops telfairi]
MARMLPLLAGLLVTGLCPTVLCHSDGTLGGMNQTEGDNQTRLDDLRFADSNTDFAFSLYKKLARNDPSKNVVFSPISISVALAFLSLGARGTTQMEILNGLKFNLTETSEAEIHQAFQHLLFVSNQLNSHLELSMSTAMFVNEALDLLGGFQEDAKALYGAETIQANFRDVAAAKKLINDYVERKSHGKIQDLISSLDPETTIILVNAIFFKANWQNPFDPHDTIKSKFHVSQTKSVNVPMMEIEDLAIPYFRDPELSCTVLELKYTGNASTLFILPDKDKMEDVEARLSPETLRRWRESLRTSVIDELYLPKFSISGSYDLDKELPQMGMRRIFSNQADLSGITGVKDMKVSQVVHKALLSVGEMGTEAAAATGVKMIPLSGRWGQLRIVNLNRPFLMVTLTNSQRILFLTRVCNPTQA